MYGSSLNYVMFPLMFQNLHSSAIKKYLFEMLKDRYQRNEKFIDRLSAVVVTKEDYESLGTLVADLFEAGFVRAVDEYKGQMAKMGMKVSVVADQTPKEGPKIFGQSEKSG